MNKLIFPVVAVATLFGYFAYAAPVDFTTSGAVDPLSPIAGQTASISATVIAPTSFNDEDAIVQFKIFNLASSPSSMVFETNYLHQNFRASQSQQYNFGWAASVSGNYVVKLGVFNHDWAINYFWNDSAALFTVGAAPTPTPSPTPEATPTPDPTPEATPTPVSAGAVVPLWIVQEQSKILQQQDLEFAVANGLITPTPSPVAIATPTLAPARVARANIRTEVKTQAEAEIVVKEPESSPSATFSPISRPAVDSGLEANINQGSWLGRLVGRILDIFR